MGAAALESPAGDWLYIARGEPQGGVVRLALPAANGPLQPVNANFRPQKTPAFGTSATMEWSS